MTHCHCDRVSPCSCAKFSAMAPNPIFFTASTTVRQVRGRCPVPAWLVVHLPSRSSMQSSGVPPLFNLMASMVWYSTSRKVPKCCHFASSWWLRALTMSAGKGEEGGTWSYCPVKKTAVLPQTHRQFWAVEVWEGRGRWKHHGLVSQREVVMGCVEEGE